MKILLDECVPSPLRKLLAGHECHTAQEMGWKSIRNGELLALAEGKFDSSLPTKASAMNKIFAVAGSRFWNSRQTSFVQSKPLPHNYATPSRQCPAQNSVVLKFLYELSLKSRHRLMNLKPIPGKNMPKWAKAASQAHRRATKKKRAELRQRGLPIIWKDGKVCEVSA